MISQQAKTLRLVEESEDTESESIAPLESDSDEGGLEQLCSGEELHGGLRASMLTYNTYSTIYNTAITQMHTSKH